MFNSAVRRARSVAFLAVAASLAVGGIAAAQQGEGSQSGPQARQGKPAGQQGPPPVGLPAGMTYAQVHVERNGEAQVIRLDEGKVVSVDEHSITVRENDGSEATIPVDEGTTVRGRPGAETSLSDLKEGQLVVVCGPEGATAKSILIVPKRGGHGPGRRAATGKGRPQRGPLSKGAPGRR